MLHSEERLRQSLLEASASTAGSVDTSVVDAGPSVTCLIAVTCSDLPAMGRSAVVALDFSRARSPFLLHIGPLVIKNLRGGCLFAAHHLESPYNEDKTAC